MSGATVGAPVLLLGAVGVVVLGLLALRRFEWFVLAVLATRTLGDLGRSRAGGGEAAAVLGYLIVVAGALWLARPRDVDGWRGPSRLVWSMAAVVAAAGLSGLWAPEPLVATADVARLASVTMMLAIMERLVRGRASARRVLTAVYLSAVLPLGVALVQLGTGSGMRVVDGFSRVTGTFVHPNPLAMYLVLLLVMGVGLIPVVGTRARVGLVALWLVGGGVLVGTYARGAWLALLVGVLVVALVRRSKLVLSGIAVAVILITAAVPSAVARFADLGTPDRASGAASNSLSWRLDYWSRAMELLPERPLTGVGLGQVAVRLPEGVPPHNDYVRVLVETGILGAAAYLWFLVTLVTTAVQAIRRAPPGLGTGVAAGFAGVVAAVLVLGLSANVMTQSVVLWYFCAFAGVASSVAIRASRAVEPVPAVVPPAATPTATPAGTPTVASVPSTA